MQFVRLVHTAGEQSVGACSILWFTRGSVFKFVQFIPGSYSQVFNRSNVVEHSFAHFGEHTFFGGVCYLPCSTMYYIKTHERN